MDLIEIGTLGRLRNNAIDHYLSPSVQLKG